MEVSTETRGQRSHFIALALGLHFAEHVSRPKCAKCHSFLSTIQTTDTTTTRCSFIDLSKKGTIKNFRSELFATYPLGALSLNHAECTNRRQYRESEISEFLSVEELEILELPFGERVPWQGGISSKHCIGFRDRQYFSTTDFLYPGD